MDTIDRNELAAPKPAMVLRELRAVREIPRLLWRAPRALTLPRGSARVMVFPGYGTSDTATVPLRGFLGSLGHRTHGWGQGRNIGNVNGQIDAVRSEVERLVREDGGPLALIGWSLGGVFAREIARDNPDWVSHVFTLATPVVGGPRFTRSARDYDPDTLDEIEIQVDERNQTLIERPVTAFYTRLDGVVDWRACIDTVSPDVEHVEVRSTHAGITIDPDVWGGIARRLAEAG